MTEEAKQSCVPPIDTVKAGLILYHQRNDQFGNGGDKPYHPLFNYFCTHPYYGFPGMNTYKYELMFDVERMIHLTKDYRWEDLQESVDAETRHEFKLVALGMSQFRCNGVYFDFPADPEKGYQASNEYIFSPEIVQTHLKLLSKDIKNPAIPEFEESGFHSSDA